MIKGTPSPGDSSERSASALAAKRETLTSRAKRIIGRALETPKENGGSTPHKGPPKKSPTKRREQVLQAQRTHRQRTQGYIKLLEGEVLHFRESETTLKAKNELLIKKIKALEQHILVNNLTLPAGYELFTQTPSGAEDALSPAAQSTEGTVNTNYSGGLTPGIFGSDTDIGSMLSPWGSGPVTPVVNVDLTSMANMKGCKPSNHNTEQDICPEYHQPHPSLLPQRNDQGTSGALYTPQNAIDFILELERVCFAHIKEQLLVDRSPIQGIPDSNFGPNHVYMATTNIINHVLPQDPTQHPFSVPGQDLDSLLKTSLLLDFGSDVTPIQVLANIHRLAKNGWVIDNSTLKSFIQELSKYMRCNGYGAVVQKSTIQAVFRVFFPGEDYQDISSWPTF